MCVCVFFKDFERKRRPLSIIANRVSCCTSRLMAKKSGCQYRVSKPRKDLCGRRLVFSKFTFGFFSQRSRIIFSTVNRYKLEHSKSFSLLLESSAIRFQSVEENQKNHPCLQIFSSESRKQEERNTQKTKEEPNTNKKERKKKSHEIRFGRV